MDNDKPPIEDLDSTETAHPQSPILPERIGRYRLLQKIGEGGMGVVYEAEQERPVRRKIALKIIKPGMDSRQVLARFEAERQALAMMNHLNVAKVFDAGATEQGRPYFAMELVKGEPITKHCDRQRLTTHERIELFMQVCDGVQHSHQKGIIHRDIKPSNILVQIEDDKRIPKIIDFGVAKATQQRLTERTLFTEQGVMIGTPEYMSPEQAEMTVEDIDTRTDVYSLGVLLYELLVGALPFDPKELREAGFDEIRRKIREEEPPTPSKRVSTLGETSTELAKRRKTDRSTLERQLKGDLDWITLRALEKDRTRRYASASELAADLGRHLKNELVLASPPSTIYRVGKFVRRHRFGVTAAAGLLVALVLGMGGTFYGMIQAKREAATSEQVLEFMVGMFEVSDPSEARGKSITAREILDKAAAKIEKELGGRPRIQSQLMATMGEVYRKLGLYAQAEPLLEQALETRRRVLGDDHVKTLEAVTSLGVLYFRQGRYDEAEPLQLASLESRKRVLGDDHPDTLNSMNNLAILYYSQGRYDEAEPLQLASLESRKRVLGDDHPDTLVSMASLAILYWSQGRSDEAESLHLATLETRGHVLGDDHPDTLHSMRSLANLYRKQGRYDEAEPLHLATLATEKRVFGDHHRNTLNSMASLAILYKSQGRYDEAEPLYLATLATQERVLGDDHPDTLWSMNNLANLYYIQGRYDEAEPLHVASLEIRKRVLRDNHPDTLVSMNNLANLYWKQGRYDEAEPLYLESLATRKRVLGDDHPDTLNSMNNLANLYRSQGRYDEAEPLYVATLESRKHELGDDHPDTLRSMNNLAWFLLTREPIDSRDPQTALQLALEVADEDEYKNPGHLDTLSLAYHLTGDTAKAIENQKKAILLLPEEESPQRASFEATLAKYEVALESGSN